MKNKYWSSIVLTLAILILLFLEIFTLFILGPIRFLQDMKNMEGIAYFLTNNLPYYRIILLGTIVWATIGFFKKPKLYPKILIGVSMLIYFGLFYVSNFVLKTNKLFYDQNKTNCLPMTSNVVPLDEDVLGVTLNGESRAYPLDYLAYHHKVLDSVGNEPVLITYCIWSRTGRIFSPVIDGNLEAFSLVGITEYNAIIADQTSGTWWRQASGEGIAGNKKGKKLDEIYFEQMPLASWAEAYPNTLVLQPDSSFIEEYEHNGRFVSRFGVEENGAEYDSWKERSWVIGITNNGSAMAFDYHYLIEYKLMQDSVGDMPVLVVLEPDSISFHTWDRRVGDRLLSFEYIQDDNMLLETQTESIWDMSGTCISGSLAGEKLKHVQSYEEYWHSWESFHPDTEKAGCDLPGYFGF